jgi:hypothetical protein
VARGAPDAPAPPRRPVSPPTPPPPAPDDGAAAPPPGAPRSPKAAAMERLETRMLRARVVRDVVQVVALTAAAAWALYTFWYQARYLPAHEAPNVVLTSSLEIVADRDGFVALKAKLSAHNPGKASVRIITESVSLVGARFAEGAGTPLGPDALPAGRTSWTLGSGVDAAGAALLASQVDTAVPPDTQALEPNETIERTHVFRVSKRDWDVATLTYYAAFNNLRQPAPNPSHFARRAGPDGVILEPALPKGVPGDLSVLSTQSRAIAVLPR